MYRYIWLVPLLPLIGAAINGIFGRWFRFPEKLVGGIAVGTIALSFLISVAAIYAYGFSGNALWPNPYVTTQTSFTWISGGAVRQSLGQGEIALVETGAVSVYPRSSLLSIEWSYQLDPLSAVFMLIVTGVGLCIFVFATGYMHGDPGFYRFFAYMGLFMFSMLVLVMGSNFVMMFVGWEGVGLCSYLLIGYYFNREEAANASRKAFITNRIGDFGFILAIFGIIATFGSAQYTDVIPAAAAYPVETLGHWGLMSWIALGLMIGACGKSAQFPLHVWLPDAMAGPTPVSALIHAATMVTAGLYMLTRTNVIFQHSKTMMLVVAVVGALTAIFAATIGITQNDIKKVLAYSTVSQLGFMFLAAGVGAFSAAIFHLMTHAFFKACLFLGSGSVIHGMNGEQDMRKMGGLRKYIPFTHRTMLVATLAIAGIPPLAGFFSKDEILAGAFVKRFETLPAPWSHIPLLCWILGMIAAAFTAFYMFRLYYMTFWGEYRGARVAGIEASEPTHVGHDLIAPHTPLHPEAAPKAPADDHHGGHAAQPHESPLSMTLVLAILAILSIIGGFVGPPLGAFGSHHENMFQRWLEPVLEPIA